MQDRRGTLGAPWGCMNNIETEPIGSHRFLPSNRAPGLDAPSARVLLAEDDREMRDMVAGALRSDGYEVVTAQDGGDLLLEIGASAVTGDGVGAYDILVSDVRMPVCSGLRVLE